jgi:hypothetical protein
VRTTVAITAVVAMLPSMAAAGEVGFDIDKKGTQLVISNSFDGEDNTITLRSLVLNGLRQCSLKLPNSGVLRFGRDWTLLVPAACGPVRTIITTDEDGSRTHFRCAAKECFALDP